MSKDASATKVSEVLSINYLFVAKCHDGIPVRNTCTKRGVGLLQTLLGNFEYTLTGNIFPLSCGWLGLRCF